MIILIPAILVLLGIAFFVVTWYYSGVLYDRALKIKENELEYNVTASAISEDLVRLEDGPDNGRWMLPGKWGLSWEGGRGMIKEIEEEGNDFLVRRFTLAEGERPSSSPALVSGDIFPNDPLAAFGIAYQEVEYETPLGMQDAWQFAGSRSTWAIFVHGHRGSRSNGLSSLPVLQELGIPALYITYRNDRGQPMDPSRQYQYGLTEWQDLNSAVEYVLSQPGAREVVLLGHSMGGGIVVKFLYESSLAGAVSGVVLDSPMLDFNAPIDSGARRRHLPGFLTASAKWMTKVRYGVDWDALNYLKDVDRLNVPILLIHGEDDTQVPKHTSDTLAKLRPDLVTYSEYSNAKHVNSWNVDPERYEQELREFLLRVSN